MTYIRKHQPGRREFISPVPFTRPPISWLREHNKRTADHIHRCDCERFIEKELG